LEEPPESVIFVLATTDPQKVPATIISRCQCFDFHSVSRKTIQTRNNTSADIVTYTIRDICDLRYYVDEYSPSSYFEGKIYVEIHPLCKSFPETEW
jgi:hypothetical protein